MSSVTPKTKLWIGERVREYFVPRKVLGGLISREEITRVETIDNEVHIASLEPLKVFLNGRPLIPPLDKELK